MPQARAGAGAAHESGGGRGEHGRGRGRTTASSPPDLVMGLHLGPEWDGGTPSRHRDVWLARAWGAVEGAERRDTRKAGRGFRGLAVGDDDAS